MIGESPRSYTVSNTSSTEQFIVIFQDFSLTSDLFMTFYRVVLYARMVFLLLLYTLTTTSIVTQSHICKLYSSTSCTICLLTHHLSNVKIRVQFFKYLMLCGCWCFMTPKKGGARHSSPILFLTILFDKLQLFLWFCFNLKLELGLFFGLFFCLSLCCCLQIPI